MSPVIILSCASWLVSFDNAYQHHTTGDILALGSGYYITSDTSQFTRFFFKKDIPAGIDYVEEKLEKNFEELKFKGQCADRQGEEYWVLDLKYQDIKS